MDLDYFCHLAFIDIQYVGLHHKLWTHYVIVSYNFVAIFVVLFLSYTTCVFFKVLFCFAYLGM